MVRDLEKYKDVRRDAIVATCSCNSTCTPSGSYTASNFPDSPSPVVAYKATYYVQYYQGVCNSVGVSSHETWLTTQGASYTYLEFTSFRPSPGDPTYGYYPGCGSNSQLSTGSHYSGTYPSPLTGTTGSHFTNQVQSHCWYFPRHAYGYMQLN
ncbi:MAG TPA: hypothetical protein VGE45_21595 [Chloroflexia bacterium]